MSTNQALALPQAPPSSLADVGRLTRQQIEIIKLTIAKGATDLELAFFIEVCKQRGLDPFMGEIHFAKFHDKRTNSDVVVPINAADGYRKYANRSADYLGQVGPLWCGPDGNWRDIWLDSQPPAAAKVGVLRRGNPEPTWGYAKWSEFSKSGDDAMFWRKMPAHQLALAAERQALRKSFGQQREDLRLLDTHHLLAKALQLLREATPPDRALIESDTQRQELLFGPDEPEQIEPTPTQPTPAPPAASTTPPAATGGGKPWTRDGYARFAAATLSQQGMGLANDDVKRFLALNGTPGEIFRYTVDEAIARCRECQQQELAAEEAAALAQVAGEEQQASLAEQLFGGS